MLYANISEDIIQKLIADFTEKNSVIVINIIKYATNTKSATTINTEFIPSIKRGVVIDALSDAITDINAIKTILEERELK